MEPEEWTLKTTGLLKGLALNPEPYSLCRLHGLCWCTSQRVASTFKIGHVLSFICLSNVKSALNEVGSRMHPCGLHLKQEASKQMAHTQPERPGFYMGGYQSYDPFLGTLTISGCIIIGIQQGTIIVTTTHKLSELRHTLPLSTPNPNPIWAIDGRKCQASCKVKALGLKVFPGDPSL